MPFHGSLFFGFGLRLDRLEVGIQRSLHVHDEIARIRHVHDQIRPHHALVGDDTELFGEIAVLAQARQLDHPAQSHLTPAPAHLGATQGGDKIARLALQLNMSTCETVDLHAQ